MSQDIGTQIQDGGVPKPSHLERVWNLFFGTTLPWAPRLCAQVTFPAPLFDDLIFCLEPMVQWYLLLLFMFFTSAVCSLLVSFQQQVSHFSISPSLVAHPAPQAATRVEY